MTIIHITDQQTWKKALESGVYKADALESSGFIHCCLSEQVNGVLDKWFQGVNDLISIELDPQKIKSKIVFENLEGGEEVFPHIYGPINLDAVISIKTI